MSNARSSSTLLALVATFTLVAGCSGSDSDAPRTKDNLEQVQDDVADEQVSSGLPPECTDVFPYAWGTPDLADADLLPSGWPQPPADAVLCNAGYTSGSIQSVEYALATPSTTVLDHYATALTGVEATEFSREERAELGREVITGTAGDVGFEIEPRDGGYRILLAAP
ncbi:hypothetical protein ACLM5J_02935 [Nocardioides sp. Bht2]|uniref:hypothetical protein n=1 Tax=Nocardioides sp. Bht2 TaxID=3392297 RepID=UPI0039B5F533